MDLDEHLGESPPPNMHAFAAMEDEIVGMLGGQYSD
jgi:hypothetical protein